MKGIAGRGGEGVKQGDLRREKLSEDGLKVPFRHEGKMKQKPPTQTRDSKKIKET